ncbi:nitroreductase family protein [Patescibacteria group bacterium]|nr:nitroreductase family protein [Patescibacteria group bacterium]
MDIYDAIKKRRSVRAYKKTGPDKAALERILKATRLAPSAHNKQDYKFILVENPQKRAALARAAGQSFVSQAPIIIAAVSTNPGHIMQCGIPAHPVDIAIALDHLTLAAAAEGLGTCWIGAFSQEDAKRILNIPEECKVVALMPLGVPGDGPEEKIRKNLGDLIRHDNFV